MKIAVLITGKLDYFKGTYNNINDRLLSLLGDYDVFVSTWDLPEQDKTDLISLYNPKVLDIETFNENTKYLIHNHSAYQKALDIEPKYGTRNSLYMWYKINRGLNLIKEYSSFNNTEYDLIIRFRTDFFFYEPDENGNFYEEVDSSQVGSKGYEALTVHLLNDTLFFVLDKTQGRSEEFLGIRIK